MHTTHITTPRLLAALSLIVIAAVPIVASAGAPAIEITPTVGYRWGGELLAEDNALFGTDVKLDESEAFGLIIDVPITRNLFVELMADRQETDLGESELFGIDNVADIEVTYYHVGVLYQWNLEHASPFVVGGIGLAKLDPDVPGSSSDERFSASVGGGIKLQVSEHVGFRFEGRGYWTNTDTDDWDDWWDECDDDCWDGDDDLLQGEVKVGLILTF
jgi:opacity protein-like surface antigen